LEVDVTDIVDDPQDSIDVDQRLERIEDLLTYIATILEKGFETGLTLEDTKDAS
jgi:hypothetical protein